MKKLFLLIILIAAGVGIYLNLNERPNQIITGLDSSSTEPKETESEQLEKKSSKSHSVGHIDVKKHPAYESVKNYAVGDDALLEQWTGREEELIEFLSAASDETIDCLKKDLCGEKPDPNSPYFDVDNTPSHGLLERELGLLVRLKEDGKLKGDSISPEQMEQALDIKNEAIQSLALELRLAAGIDDVSFSRLLGRTPALLPKASAGALAQLSKESKASTARREELINTAKSLLASEDQMRAVEMSKRVKYLALNISELEALAANTCELLPQNRKVVQHNLLVAGEGVGADLSFNCD